MYFTSTIMATLAATAALAAPAALNARDLGNWSFNGVTRSCTDQQCHWYFEIGAGLPNGGPSFVQPCDYYVNAASGKIAARSNGGPANCGDFTLTSGWSNQFGDDHGFTTLSVVYNPLRQIAFPAYSDDELADGKADDKTYPVQQL